MSTYTKYGYVQKREHKNPKLCSMFPIPHEERFPIMQRMFELGLQGHSADMLSKFLKQEFPELRASLNKTMIDKRLRDSFYCGLWVVKKGSKQERTIELSKLTLPDGTRFEPAISRDNFERLQLIRVANRNGAIIKRKRINPLPQLVNC